MNPRNNSASSPGRPARRRPSALLAMAGALSVAALALSGCTSAAGSTGSSVINTQVSEETSTFFNNDQVHEISVQADPEELNAALEAYEKDQSKEWITATATIDGTTFENVGLRLKGNSTLRMADTSSDYEQLPWQIKLDKYVDGQTYSGRGSFVIRTNTSETALNEAVALDLLGEAGLATEQAAATRFSLNGSDGQLRLVIENPSDKYYSAESFNGEGITYKSDASGDYSYRGDDPADYQEAFSVEAGVDDWTPVMEFLDFVNNSSDEDFASQLSEHLDIDQFANYLAMQDLVANSDDIDGPGNNSYLRYDTASGTMTVVAWDQNLSYGGMGGGKGFSPDAIIDQLLPEGMELEEFTEQVESGTVPEGFELPRGMELPEGTELIEALQSLLDGELPEGMGGGPGGGMDMPDDGQMPQLPEGMDPPADGQRPQAPGGNQDGDDAEAGDQAQPGDGGGRGGGPMGGNALSERFLENEEFAAQVDQAAADLKSELYDSGKAEEILSGWEELLTSEASDLVDAKTIASEADAIREYFTGEQSGGRGAGTGEQPKNEEDGESPAASPAEDASQS